MDKREIDQHQVFSEQRYLNVKQAAHYLGLSAKTLYGWAENGEMPSYKVGRARRFDREELDAFVKKGNCYTPLDAVGLGRKED